MVNEVSGRVVVITGASSGIGQATALRLGAEGYRVALAARRTDRLEETASRIAEAGGVSVIMDRCIKVEHARYVGRMHWLGFNTQRITSVRGGLQ